MKKKVLSSVFIQNISGKFLYVARLHLQMFRHMNSGWCRFEIATFIPSNHNKIKTNVKISN